MRCHRLPLFRALPWALLLTLLGCAPVLSQRILDQAGGPVVFAELVNHPDPWRDRVVVLGGTLLQVHTDENRSLLEILEQPLGFRLQPIPGDRSGGRFLVQLAGKADPAVWTLNRPITLAGRVLGTELRPLGQTHYRYPVLTLEEVHLWPRPGTWDSGPRVFFGIGGNVSF